MATPAVLDQDLMLPTPPLYRDADAVLPPTFEEVVTSTQPARYDAFAGNDDVTLASPSDYMIIQPPSYAEATSSTTSVTTQRASTAVLISDAGENEDDGDDDVFVN